MSIKHEFLAKSGTMTVQLTPMTAIRWKCLECSNFNKAEIQECSFRTCALYPFRMGDAHSGRTLSEDAKKKVVAQLRNARSCKKTLFQNRETKRKISSEGVV